MSHTTERADDTLELFSSQRRSVRDAVLDAEFRVDRARGRGSASLADLEDLLDTIELLAVERLDRRLPAL